MATNKRNLNSKKYNKALTLEDRINITNLISSNRDNSGNLTITLNEIAAILEKDPTTISKEVKNRRSKFKQLSFNFVYAISYCKHCAKQSKYEIKQMVKDANDSCEEFEEYICPHLKNFLGYVTDVLREVFVVVQKLIIRHQKLILAIVTH